jgi:hypothetical protein
MSPNKYNHWTAAVHRSARLARWRGYPRKLRMVVGDPRTRVGTFFGDLHELAARHDAAGNLTPYEFRVFSQNGEDGIIAELVRRIGVGCPRTFVEFGAGAGRSGNCVFLADALAWEGLFIEPAADDFAQLSRKYGYTDRVRTMPEFVTPDNLDDLIERAGLTQIGVMSIDVDGNDYYIWQALRTRPAIVVIEYNGNLPLDRILVQPFADAPWDGTTYYGSSLAALTALGKQLGYSLVHTELTGTNAFFVADEHVAAFTDIVEVPARIANYELLGFGHPPDPEERAYRDESSLGLA